jgi:hypothetical protein
MLREGYLSALADHLRGVLDTNQDVEAIETAADRLDLYAAAYDQIAAAEGLPALRATLKQDRPDDCEEMPF